MPDHACAAANRVLALQLAISTLAPDGGLDPVLVPAVMSTADSYRVFLDGPAFLILTAASTTFDQAAPDGPGTPTILKGTNAVQLTDIQQVTLSVAETDSKNQPVSDQLAWSVDNGTIIAITPSADTQSCLCVAGVDGTATVTVTDNSVSPALTGTETFTVVSSAATALVINAGTPEDQPPAPAPAPSA